MRNKNECRLELVINQTWMYNSHILVQRLDSDSKS